MKGPAARVQSPTSRRAAAQTQRTPVTSPLSPGAALIQKTAGNRAVSSLMPREGVPRAGEPADPRQNDVRRALGAPGQRLAGEILNRLESSFGRSLEHIRIHTDAGAQDSARALEANAYAVGHHIVFAAGAYDPGSPAGRRLIAHEVAHTLQQEGGLPDPLDALRISRPGERGEQAAEMAASAAMAGLPVPVLTREAVGIYRDKNSKPQTADAKPKTPGWNETILHSLIQGKYAFEGDYKATKPGKFEAFINPDLNVALQFYTTEWQPGSGQEKTPQEKQIEASQQKMAAQQEKKLAEQKANRERKLETSETEQVAKLERSIALSERKKELARREWEPRIQKETNPERKAMFQRFLDLRIRLAGVPFYPEEIWERYKAKKADEEENTTSHMEEFRAQRQERAMRRAMYQSLQKRLSKIEERKTGLEEFRSKIPELEQKVQDAEAAYEKALDKRDQFPARQKSKWMTKNLDDQVEKARVNLAAATGALEEAQQSAQTQQTGIENDEFKTRRLRLYVAPQLHRENAPEFAEDREFVEKRLNDEKERNEEIAGGQHPGEEPASRYEDLAREVTRLSPAEQLKALRDEQEVAQGNVNTAGFIIAGDTGGVFIADHPEWAKQLLRKLIALGPQGKKGYSRAGAPPWDDLASGAQALLHAFLNAWSKRRILKASLKPGETLSEEDFEKRLKQVRLPSNIEVMNAAAGYSVTNDRSMILGGYKGAMDWCGPATQKSVVLGLWKAGLYLKTVKGMHFKEIKDGYDAVLAEQAKEKPDAAKIKRLWDAMGGVVRADLDAQDNFLISTYLDNIDLEDPAFVAAYRNAKSKPALNEYDRKVKAQANKQGLDPSRKRHIADPKEIAFARLFPGDFVYWVSSYPFGPMAGHVATIIAEESFDENAPKRMNAPLSKIYVDSGNAGGAVAHEGSVRPEVQTRAVMNLDPGYSYFKIAGEANTYYYNMRPEYDSLVKKLTALRAKRSPTPAETAQIEALEATRRTKYDAIERYKARHTDWPVQKASDPDSPADAIGNGATVWNEKKSLVVPDKPDTVWIVSINRTGSFLNPRELLKDDPNKPAEKKLSENGLGIMPAETQEAIKRYFAEGLGLPTLLLSEKDMPNAAPPKQPPAQK